MFKRFIALGIEEVSSCRSCSLLGSRHVRRATSTRRPSLDGVEKDGIVVWDEDADRQSRKDEEDDQAIENGAEGSGHDSARVNGLRGHQGEHIGTGDSERCAKKTRPKRLEITA